MEEYIVLVDENNQETGYGEKIDTHRKGILHRAFSIFVYDLENKKVLMQHRAAGKYHSGNCWSNSCCSHQRKGETLPQSLARCIQDELGVESINKEVVFDIEEDSFAYHCGIFHYYAPYETLSEHEMDNVFLYCVGKGNNETFPLENIPFNPEEIQDLKWISVEELDAWLEKSPEAFSAWFSRAYALARKKIVEIEKEGKNIIYQ
ncbi:MAG: NUDIX domain-containing protein [Firmicutes bacterium]|nr:NUDIX domain-containing protein [Bacillota bacterium]